MPKYRVIYFGFRGLAEPIRQLLTLAGQPFEDERIERENWTPEKKLELGLEWGQLPALEIDGELKSQTFAICKYLATKYNLAGKDEQEEFRCDVLVEAARDFVKKMNPLIASLMAGDTAKLEEQKKAFAETEAPPILGKFNEILERKGNIWLVGESLTWADVIVVHFVTSFETAFELKLTTGLASLEKLITAVHNEPRLKLWIENRPKTQF